MDKCTECENETMLKYSSLYCDYEDLQERLKITAELLGAMTKMADYFQKKCDYNHIFIKNYVIFVDSLILKHYN